MKNQNGALPIKSGKVAVLGEGNFIYDTTNAGGTMKIDKALATSLSEALAYNGLAVQSDLSGLTSADTAIVVVGRAGGETVDLATGSLAMTADEQKLVTDAKASGAKVVLLVSGDFSVEIDDCKRDAFALR